MTRFIEIPLINPNDVDARITRWTKADGALVQKGEIIAMLETTKATFDLEAEETGYLRIFIQEGAPINVGEIVGAICENPDESAQLPTPVQAEAIVDTRKLTKKAEIAARKAGLAIDKVLAEIAGAGAITESDINAYVQRRGVRNRGVTIPDALDTVDDVYRGNRQQRLLIVGAGRGAAQLLDSLSRIETQRATVIVDDNPDLHGKTLMGVPVAGESERIEALFKEKAFDAAIISVSTSIAFRQRMFEKLSQLEIPLANVVDPTARVQRNAVLGSGNVILAFCHIGSCAILGNGNFLSPYVDIEHHCIVGDFCTFGPGVMASASVRIGQCVKFGTGIFIEPEIAIGAKSVIGSGAILTRDIPPNSIAKTRVNYTIRLRD